MECSKLPTFICFLSLALLITFPPTVIVMIATEDLVAGTLIPSTVVVLTYSITDVIVKIFCPFIIRRVSWLASIIITTMLFLISTSLVVVIDDVRVRLLGVALIGAANGYGMVLILKMIPHYSEVEKNTSAFQVGANISKLTASLVYTGLTSWFCIAPRYGVSICVPLSFVIIVIYSLLDKTPLNSTEKSSKASDVTSSEKAKYAPIPTADKWTKNDQYTSITASSSTMHLEPRFSKIFLRKVYIKLKDLYLVFPYFSYFLLALLILILTVNGVLTTLTFPSAPFRIRDHYQYYRLLVDIGAFLGGSELLIISILRPEWTTTLRVRKVWILVILSSCHLIFFTFASWYRFVPSVYIVLALCFTTGYLFSSTLANTLICTTECFKSIDKKGTALGIVAVGCSLGQIVGGLFGIHVESMLKKHCTEELLLGNFCLARFSTHAAWNSNSDCRV